MWATLKQQLLDQLTADLPETVIWAAFDAEIPDADTVFVQRAGSKTQRALFAQQTGTEDFIIGCLVGDEDEIEADLKLQSLENLVVVALAKAAKAPPIAGIVINSLETDGDQFRPKVYSQFSITVTWRIYA